jgi:hypothetical protein
MGTDEPNPVDGIKMSRHRGKGGLRSLALRSESKEEFRSEFEKFAEPKVRNI